MDEASARPTHLLNSITGDLPVLPKLTRHAGVVACRRRSVQAS